MEVNSYLTAHNTPMLCQLPGFSDFDPALEVLHCDKPGTNSVNASKALNLKIMILLKGKGGVTVSLVDNESTLSHKNAYDDTLILIDLTIIHVVDLKITGAGTWINHILTFIQHEFRKLKVNWHVLANSEV